MTAIKTRNIKVNEDGTLSVANPSEPWQVVEGDVPLELVTTFTGFGEESHGSIKEMDTRWPCNNHLEPYLNPECAVKCEICGRGRV